MGERTGALRLLLLTTSRSRRASFVASPNRSLRAQWPPRALHRAALVPRLPAILPRRAPRLLLRPQRVHIYIRVVLLYPFDSLATTTSHLPALCAVVCLRVLVYISIDTCFAGGWNGSNESSRNQPPPEPAAPIPADETEVERELRQLDAMPDWQLTAAQRRRAELLRAQVEDERRNRVRQKV